MIADTTHNAGSVQPCGHPNHGSPDHDCAPFRAEIAQIQRGLNGAPVTYGLCLHCRSIEVALNKVSGTRDLSSIGESDTYPTGYGCELCA